MTTQKTTTTPLRRPLTNRNPAHVFILMTAASALACGQADTIAVLARDAGGAPTATPGYGADASAPPGSGGDGAPSSPDAAGPQGDGPALPQATGACPTFKAGTLSFTPAGLPARSARVWMSDAAATKHGPLVIYWHATGSVVGEAQYSLGATINDIVAAGGIVVSPEGDPAAGQFVWYLVSGAKDDDLRVADEIVACAQKTVGIDAKHIHSMGMSAGGLQTTAMSFLRSSYLASVAIYSGGLGAAAPPYQDAANKFAAMIFYGGATDTAFGFDFQAATTKLRTQLVGDGHFTILCNHNKGHMVPLDAAPSVWKFFQAHGFGTKPEPYAAGLPSDFPSYCAL